MDEIFKPENFRNEIVVKRGEGRICFISSILSIECTTQMIQFFGALSSPIQDILLLLLNTYLSQSGWGLEQC